MSSTSDRNLLIGVMALQLDFVTRDQLISAMGAWVLDKTKSLDEILLEQNSLNADVRGLLLALVEKHVDHHDGDSQKSLASISSLGSVRRDLQSLEDAEVDASLARTAMRGTDAPPSTPEIGPLPGPRDPSTRSQRFRILRPHAQGGLGEVSVALDEELNREVALKQIQERFADDTNSRARFVVEAEITGGLEHPGIVPVYGLGQYGDGRPYYAMRFIRGDSLKTAADQFHKADWTDQHARAMELRRLLGRFVDVCDAIEYAHSRGVLHRDLKPGNIMLGKYGETLVVDWGLAKPEAVVETTDATIQGPLIPSSGSGAALTIGGSVIGTPQYMSPEQAAGRFTEMGTASDVYSLGVTLYYLLTGQTPFEDKSSDTKPSVEQVLARVQQGDYPRPREVDELAPRPLEAICEKAMSMRPEDRYGSPGALADDIEHWLADEPVSAHPETIATRVRRWVKWHQTLVASAAAAVLVAAVSLGALVVVVAGMNQRLTSVNSQLRAARDREHTARVAADRHADVALTQRKLALDTLSSVIFDIQNRLRSYPAARQVRLSLLETALGGLQSVEATLETQSEVDQNTAVAYHELGRIFYGVGDESGLGGTNSAARVFQNAHKIARKMLDDDPESPAALLIWAQANSDLGQVSRYLGDTSRAAELYQVAYETRQRLRTMKDDVKNQHALARALDDMASISVRQGRSEDAAKYYTQALEIQRAAAEADPGSDSQDELASALSSIIQFYDQMNQIDEAITCAQSVLEIRQSLQNEQPDNNSRKYSCSTAYLDLAKLFFRQGDLNQARENVARSIEIASEVSAADPNTFPYQRHLASAYYTLGDVLLSMGHAEESQTKLQQSVDLCTRLIAENPGDIRPLFGAANALEKLGDICRQLTQYEDAAAHYQEQVRLLTDLSHMDPTNTLYQRDLSLGYNRVGSAYLDQKSFDEALSWYTKGFEMIVELRENDPRDERLRRDLSFSYNKIGDVHFFAGQDEQALESYAKGIEIRQSLADDHPDDIRGIQDLAVSLERMGNANAQLERLDDAIVYFDRCLEIRRDLADKNPENAKCQLHVAITLTNLGAVHDGQGDQATAIKLSEEALKICRQLHSEGKLAPRYQSMIPTLEQVLEQYRQKIPEKDQP